MPTLEFKGKQFVHWHHLSGPFRELVADAKKSLLAKGRKAAREDNLIIHGNNLEVPKALPPTQAGKVDCIFIDPTFNTGKEGWHPTTSSAIPHVRPRSVRLTSS